MQYLTLDMYRPEHRLIPLSLIIMCMIVSFHAFCPYVLSEKKCFMTVLHNFCLKEKEVVST